MYKISDFNDGKNAPGKLLTEFQGRNFRDCKYLIFWLIWGEYLVDLRVVRKYFNRKPTRSFDQSFGNPCAKFTEQTSQLIDLVADQDFETILEECVKLEDEERERSRLIYEATTPLETEDPDDLPF